MTTMLGNAPPQLRSDVFPVHWLTQVIFSPYFRATLQNVLGNQFKGLHPLSESWRSSVNDSHLMVTRSVSLSRSGGPVLHRQLIDYIWVQCNTSLHLWGCCRETKHLLPGFSLDLQLSAGGVQQIGAGWMRIRNCIYFNR